MKICSGWRRCFFLIPLLFFLPHLLSGPVVELHQNSFAGDLQGSWTKKYDHLVLGPPAGQGLPDRLQCQGTKALNKTHSSTTYCNTSLCESVTFVTVFSIHKSSPNMLADGRLSNLVTVGKTSYTKVERSLAILNVFVNFIQLTIPQSNVVIITDPASELPVRRNRVTSYPIKGDYSRDRLMLQRIKSYIAFLEDKLKEHHKNEDHVNHYIFTDSDVAIVDDLRETFMRFPNFHLALTFRNNKDQPLNSGLMAVRGTSDGILRAKVFLQKVLKVYKTKYMTASRMLGDQYALAWIIKSQPSFDSRRFARPKGFEEEISGTTVLFLPCAIYNWTPPEGAGQFHGMPLDVKVVHFKGSRKRLMLESWNFYNSSSNISDMLCLILKSGRTKYDF